MPVDRSSHLERRLLHTRPLLENELLILPVQRGKGATHQETTITRTLYVQLIQERRSLEEKASSSEHEADPQTQLDTQKQPSVNTANIVVRGATEQIAYTCTVKMREVTFTCEICGQTVTQWHYPSGRIKYCSDACRTIKATQMQERRVTRQREKRICKHSIRSRCDNNPHVFLTDPHSTTNPPLEAWKISFQHSTGQFHLI